MLRGVDVGCWLVVLVYNLGFFPTSQDFQEKNTTGIFNNAGDSIQVEPGRFETLTQLMTLPHQRKTE